MVNVSSVNRLRLDEGGENSVLLRENALLLSQKLFVHNILKRCQVC